MSIRLAIAQMPSTNDLNANLGQMKEFVQEASQQKADCLVFPEMAYFMGKKAEYLPLIPKFELLLETFCQWAAEFQIDLVPGTLREPTKDPEKFLNTLCYIDSEGKTLAHYRKLFLFKAKLKDRDYNEEVISEAGKEIVTLTRAWGEVGFSICYDLRFPELFRSLRKKGAQFLFVPSAFTVPTGEAHWHTLLKARAIENQSYVIAPGLVGGCGDGRVTYGHSLIVDPWGEILTDLKEQTGISTCDLPDNFSEMADRLDVWASRREEILPIS